MPDLNSCYFRHFSVKPLTEFLKAWEGVMNPLSYPILWVSTFWQQDLLCKLVRFSRDQAKGSFQEKEESTGTGIRVSLLGFWCSHGKSKRLDYIFSFLTMFFLLLFLTYCASHVMSSYHIHDSQWEKGLWSLKNTLPHKFLIWPQRSNPHPYP